jgi:DNA-binding transcriptional LysR family regulator
VVEVEAPECFTRLDGGDLDIAITVEYLKGPGRDDPRYSRMELLTDPLLAALPDGHPLAAGPLIELKDLAQEPWIVGAMRGPCQEVSLAACTSAAFSPAIVHHANDWSAVFALVAAGCGVALVPRMSVPSDPPAGVALRALGGPLQPGRRVYAAIRAGAEAYPSLAPVLAVLQAVARG